MPVIKGYRVHDPVPETTKIWVFRPIKSYFTTMTHVYNGSVIFMEDYAVHFNSLAPGGIWLQSQISKFQTHFNDKYLMYFCEIANRWMPQHLTDH